MADKITLSAQAREDVGKGASRRLRRSSGLVPGIIYGGGKDPQKIALSHKDLLKAMEAEAFYSQVLELSVDGAGEQAIVKDLQRHPARPHVLHIDFQRVRADQKLHVNLPIHIVGEESAPGLKLHGGQLMHQTNEIEVVCLPAALPEYLVADISEMDIGGSIHLSDLPLPEGVEIPALALGEDHDQPVVSIVERRVSEEPEEGAEAAAPEGGAEAADEEESGDDED